MSTVKISQLPDIPGGLNANTSNSLFLGVDIPTGITGKFTATQLAERLYANNILNVGDNTIVLPNVIAQFSGTSNNYIQINLENDGQKGTSDYVVTADIGTDTTNYLDLGLTNSEYDNTNANNSLGTSVNKMDGYLYIQSNESNLGGNLVIGSTSTGKEIRFLLGGINSENIAAKITDSVLETKKPIKFSDATIQYTAASPANYSEAGYAQSNTNATQVVAANNYAHGAYARANAANNLATSGYAQANAANNLAVSSYVQANAANNLAVGAFAKANAALANTTGTFAGDLTITGNIKSTGIVTINNSSFSSNSALISIVASDNFATVAPSNSNYMIHVTGKANSVTRVVLDSFGDNTYPLIAGRMGRGSATTPNAVGNNDVMMRIVGNGYTGTEFPGSSPTKIDFVAAENFSDTNRGTRIEFWNTPTGSNVIQKIATFNANEATFSGTVTPSKGFIFTPRLPAGNQTAITIDYSIDSIIKANLVADLTVSHTNYVAGKVVEMWLTNNDNVNHSVTHGCAALRSTNKSTTFTITAQSSAYMRFFSIDGDNANTFVSIII